ncbi:hypothetical protein CKR_2270 [Clostridium kluyveri NBRC 12016]|nr:hypothetical protein CKR_2270 [Clostridium kluyveri NBRC 12016]
MRCMIIKNYMDIVNIHNWLKDSYTFSSIKFEEKSTLFEKKDIENTDNLIDVSLDKFIGYNYVYNYFYFLQKYIRSKNVNFDFGDFKNIYKLKDYSNNQQNADIKAFSNWFLRAGEGLSNIVDFLESLNTCNYESNKSFKILKYYNYLIEDSIYNDPEIIQTFLTEGATDPFIKINKFVIKDNIRENTKSENNSIVYSEFNNYNPWQSGCLNFSLSDDFSEPANLQVSFYNVINIMGVLQ